MHPLSCCWLKDPKETHQDPGRQCRSFETLEIGVAVLCSVVTWEYTVQNDRFPGYDDSVGVKPSKLRMSIQLILWPPAIRGPSREEERRGVRLPAVSKPHALFVPCLRLLCILVHAPETRRRCVAVSRLRRPANRRYRCRACFWSKRTLDPLGLPPVGNVCSHGCQLFRPQSV